MSHIFYPLNCLLERTEAQAQRQAVKRTLNDVLAEKAEQEGANFWQPAPKRKADEEADEEPKTKKAKTNKSTKAKSTKTNKSTKAKKARVLDDSEDEEALTLGALSLSDGDDSTDSTTKSKRKNKSTKKPAPVVLSIPSTDDEETAEPLENHDDEVPTDEAGPDGNY